MYWKDMWNMLIVTDTYTSIILPYVIGLSIRWNIVHLSSSAGE